MSKIYLLQVMFDFNNYEHHYENVYSSLELAKQVGEKWLEEELRKEYEDWFEKYTESDIPHKKKNQKFFRNSYDVIVNHNSFDEGCHVDVFNEKELELYTERLPADSPLIF